MLLFNYSITLLTFCLLVLSIAARGDEVSITVADLSLSPFSSVSCFLVLCFVCCFMYFEVLLIGAYAYRIAMYFWGIDFLSLGNFCFVSDNFLCSDVHFACYYIVTPHTFSVCMAFTLPFPSFNL